MQACEALKILSGNLDAVSRVLNMFELWDNRIRQIKLDALSEVDCPTCKRHQFEWLEGKRGSHSAVLCGRNAVQLSFPDREPVCLESLAKKLAGAGQVTSNRFLLRFEVDDYQITVFPDGRAIVAGTEEISEARTVYSKWVGL